MTFQTLYFHKIIFHHRKLFTLQNFNSKFALLLSLSKRRDIVLIDVSIEETKCIEISFFTASGNRLSIVNPTQKTRIPIPFPFPICSQLSFVLLQALSMATKIDTFQL